MLTSTLELSIVFDNRKKKWLSTPVLDKMEVTIQILTGGQDTDALQCLFYTRNL